MYLQYVTYYTPFSTPTILLGLFINHLITKKETQSVRKDGEHLFQIFPKSLVTCCIIYQEKKTGHMCFIFYFF